MRLIDEAHRLLLALPRRPAAPAAAGAMVDAETYEDDMIDSKTPQTELRILNAIGR